MTAKIVQPTTQPFPMSPLAVERPRVTPASDALVGRLALVAVLLATGFLYLWDLAASGWANAYYSAAALAGSQSWEAFLFGSFDAGNAITVDKTPAALWVMSLSVRLFGLSSWSLLVPQALMGVASVGLLYATVSRAAGRGAGLLAGIVLALTPVAALMFRFNNPDALLVLLLVGATYATTRALEGGSTRWLVLAGTLVGLGFLAKMLQAFLVIPVFSLVYLVAAPVSMRRRVAQIGAAAVAVIVASGWYLALVELWPVASRPYIGGSQTNSIIDLLLGYNGFGRITGDEVGRVGGGPGPFSDGVGLFRLFRGELATEASWLIPIAIFAFVAILVARRHAPRTDALRAQALLWGGTLGVTGLVFSLMQGIFHEYYTVALAPAIGALVGLAAALAWRHRDRMLVAVAAALGVLGSGVWTAHLLTLSPDWHPGLGTIVVFGSIGAAALIVLAATIRDRAVPAAALAAALAVLLAAPALGAIETAATAHSGALPLAEPAATMPDQGRRPAGQGAFGGRPLPATAGNGAFGNGGSGQLFNSRGRGLGGLLDAAQATPELVAALRDNAAAYTWTAATTGANNAAGLALSSETSVMAIGGFNGSDPSPTLEQFQADVAAHRIHWYVETRDSAGFRGTHGGSDEASDIASWVASRFQPQTIGGVTVYDLTGS